MMPPKTEPYQRSRHRATLQAWVVAATAVAAIGLPSTANASTRDNTQQHVQDHGQSHPLDVQQVASQWIDALMAADTTTALSMMRLPAAADHQRSVQTDLDVMSDLLAQQGVHAEPVAHRQAGHWALSAWEMNIPDTTLAPVIEPITLYNPSSDGLFEGSADWQVVPQGVGEDAALKPLYNADHQALQAWAQTLL